MIDFKRLQVDQKQQYESILFSVPNRGCEYSFANLILWGHQKVAFVHGCAAFFSHFYGRSVYPYPIGGGDRRAVISLIMEDAQQRGIPCRITNMLPSDWEELNSWFPDRFFRRTDRDGFDYVYAVDDLADLRGRKFQKKRNHFNRFRAEHPDYTVVPLTPENIPQAQCMVEDWYTHRVQEDPHGDYMLENIAMSRAFRCYSGLEMEGLMLMEGEKILAVTVGSRMAPDTFDVHFEKAREDVDGAYNAINCEFARYLRLKHPEVKFLDREDDMGLEGLRKAKLSYNPSFMVEKSWAYLHEEIVHDR